VYSPKYNRLFSYFSEFLSSANKLLLKLEKKESDFSFLSFIKLTYITLAESIDLIELTCSNGFDFPAWKQNIETNLLEENVEALQLLCTFTRMVWKMINKNQRQDYLFLLDIKLPSDMKQMCQKGLTMGDISNQATELLHSIINTICEKGVKKGLNANLLAQKVTEHFLMINLLTLEEISKLITSSNTGVELLLYKIGFPFPKSKAKKVFVDHKLKKSSTNILSMVQTYLGKDDLLELQKNFERIERTIQKGKMRGKKINFNYIKLDKTEILGESNPEKTQQREYEKDVEEEEDSDETKNEEEYETEESFIQNESQEDN
jgi:hypothetical protein